MASYYTEEATRRAEMVGRPGRRSRQPTQRQNSCAQGLPGQGRDHGLLVSGLRLVHPGDAPSQALEEDFRDQPVAVLGMNTDHNDTDAKFVIERWVSPT